jgi:hypothetical protein
MKRIIVLLLAAALLCFAMPAIASPPGPLPSLEALGPVAASASSYVAQEVSPFVAAAPGILQSAQVNFFDSIAPETQVLIIGIAIAAALAGFMRGALSPSNRLSYDPRRRFLALARDQTSEA